MYSNSHPHYNNYQPLHASCFVKQTNMRAMFANKLSYSFKKIENFYEANLPILLSNYWGIFPLQYNIMVAHTYTLTW